MEKRQLVEWINRINKKTYPPYMCPQQGMSNEEEVVLWNFRGDGTGDFEEYAPSAKPELVLSYYKECISQAVLASEYLEKSYLDKILSLLSIVSSLMMGQKIKNQKTGQIIAYNPETQDIYYEDNRQRVEVTEIASLLNDGYIGIS